MALQVFARLVKVLQLVDGDYKHSMGFLVGMLEDAKKEIKERLKNNESANKPILDIIDAKTTGRLDSPLHLASYLLNPYYYYRNGDIANYSHLMDAFVTCVDNFFPNDFDMQNKVVNVELLRYKDVKGMFERKVAIFGRSTNDAHFDPSKLFSIY